MTLKTGADRSGKTSRRSCWRLTAPNPAATSTTRIVNAGRAKAAVMRRLVIAQSSVTVFITATSAFLGFCLEQKRAFDDHRLTGFQSGDDLDVRSEIAASTDPPHLEFLRGFRQKREPLRSDPLESRGRHDEDGFCFARDLEARVGGHTRPKDTVRVRQLDANRYGAGPRVNLTSHLRHTPVELTPGQRRERHVSDAAGSQVHSVTLEHLGDQPDAAKIGHREQRRRRIRILAENGATIDHPACQWRPEVIERTVASRLVLLNPQRPETRCSCPRFSVGGAERGFGFLNLPRRDNPFSGQAALSFESLLRQISPRVRGQHVGTGPPKVGAAQLRQRRAFANLSVQVNQHADDLSASGRRHLGVSTLIGGDLAKNGDRSRSWTLGHGRGA